MKHVILSKKWKFEEEPLRGYQFNFMMEYGRNKRDRIFLPVAREVVPDKGAEGGTPVLPEGNFELIDEHDTLMVVPGKDDTPRCLLFVGCKGQARQGVDYSKTTGKVIFECSAGDNLCLHTEVVCILEPGQSLGLFTTTERSDFKFLYTWDGEGVKYLSL